jgi:predicted secreted Zn-dependent protease
MPVRLCSVTQVRVVAAALAAGLLWTTAASPAGVTSDTVYRTHWVGGTTPKTIVSFMRRNPVAGDHGAAYANIRPTYALAFDTATRGGSCRTTDVELDMRFVVTLPGTRNEARMSGRTRSAWRAFVDFARRHELQHRSSYLECGRTLVQQVQAARAGSCGELRREVRRMLETAKRNCDAKQAVFDRAERPRLAGLTLFRLGR